MDRLTDAPARAVCRENRWRLLLAAVAVLAGCRADGPPLATVPRVDLDRYLGTWYEIARYDAPFQEGCTATTATYSLRDDGLIRVENRCRVDHPDGPLREAEGKARIVDEATRAKLKVTFFWPFWADYWVIGLDPGYQWAVVGEPGRTYLWILSRTATLPEATLDEILRLVADRGYDPRPLMFTEHAKET
jgi:apolipoprotein D and lipocalin family protein